MVRKMSCMKRIINNLDLAKAGSFFVKGWKNAIFDTETGWKNATFWVKTGWKNATFGAKTGWKNAILNFKIEKSINILYR